MRRRDSLGRRRRRLSGSDDDGTLLDRITDDAGFPAGACQDGGQYLPHRRLAELHGYPRLLGNSGCLELVPLHVERDARDVAHKVNRAGQVIVKLGFGKPPVKRLADLRVGHLPGRVFGRGWGLTCGVHREEQNCAEAGNEDTVEGNAAGGHVKPPSCLWPSMLRGNFLLNAIPAASSLSRTNRQRQDRQAVNRRRCMGGIVRWAVPTGSWALVGSHLSHRQGKTAADRSRLLAMGKASLSMEESA